MHEIEKCTYNHDRKNKYQVKMMMMLMVVLLTNKSALVQSPAGTTISGHNHDKPLTHTMNRIYTCAKFKLKLH